LHFLVNQICGVCSFILRSDEGTLQMENSLPFGQLTFS
jgi:hypothetical protein